MSGVLDISRFLPSVLFWPWNLGIWALSWTFFLFVECLLYCTLILMHFDSWLPTPYLVSTHNFLKAWFLAFCISGSDILPVVEGMQLSKGYNHNKKKNYTKWPGNQTVFPYYRLYWESINGYFLFGRDKIAFSIIFYVLFAFSRITFLFFSAET